MDPDPTRRSEILETITQAAIQFPSGEIFTGEEHPAIIAKFTTEQTRTYIKGELKEGFVTSTGRFVSRNEAEDIAFKAKQIKVKTGKLTSQNLRHSK